MRKDEGRIRRRHVRSCEATFWRSRLVERERRPPSTWAHPLKGEVAIGTCHPVAYSNSMNLGARDGPFFVESRDESEAFLSRRSPAEVLREGEYKTRPALPSRITAPHDSPAELTSTGLITAQAQMMHDVSYAAHFWLVDLSCFAATEL
jgi:hypothetical protein